MESLSQVPVAPALLQSEQAAEQRVKSESRTGGTLCSWRRHILAV
jgi:hypothetical protein